MKSKCLLLLICLLFLNGCSLVILGITQNRIDALQEKMLYKDKGVLFAIGQDKTLPFQSTANKEIIVHVKVKSIKPLSDAEKAGLMTGDVIPDAQAAGRSRAQRMHFRDLGDDQAGAAFGPAVDISQVRFTDCAVLIAESCSHRRHDQPVGNFQILNTDWRKQVL